MFETSDAIKMIYSDTLIPDIFISEYMPSLNDNQVKVYIYCCFLNKNNKNINEIILSNIFKLSTNDMTDILYTLIEAGLLYKTNTSLKVTDLKEVTLNKTYKLKTSPDKKGLGNKKNIVSSINARFFQGVMAISWYTLVDTLFNLYKFDDDVMYSLFSYCFERGALKKPYIEVVAKSWSEHGVKNYFDLEKYLGEHKKFKTLSNKIAKRLNRKTPLTQYEEQYIEKWLKEYKFSFEIIEIALKNTTKISNPNLEYVHKILTTWYKNGYKTKAEIVKGNKKYFENKGVKQNSKNTDVRKYYEDIRKINQEETNKRKEEVYKKIPSFKQIEDDIMSLSLQALSSSGEEKRNIINKIKKNEQKKLSLLLENEFNKTYLNQIFTCKLCKDTGILPNGNVCTCRKEASKA